MEDDFTDLQRLLRLKRHEAPPPDFMEDFLIEFHQRQRAELLKRPLWRLALDRFEGALPTFQVQRYAYAGSFAAAVLLAGVGARQLLVSPVAGANVSGTTIALVAPQQMAVPVKLDDQPQLRFNKPAPAYAYQSPRLDIYSQRPAVSLAEVDFDHPRPRAASATMTRNPRYVLDAQPVSYERPESF